VLLDIDDGLLLVESVAVREKRNEVGEKCAHVLRLDLPGAIEALDARCRLKGDRDVIVPGVEELGVQAR
jgi:hypothetical protein